MRDRGCRIEVEPQKEATQRRRVAYSQKDDDLMSLVIVAVTVFSIVVFLVVLLLWYLGTFDAVATHEALKSLHRDDIPQLV